MKEFLDRMDLPIFILASLSGLYLMWNFGRMFERIKIIHLKIAEIHAKLFHDEPKKKP